MTNSTKSPNHMKRVPSNGNPARSQHAYLGDADPLVALQVDGLKGKRVGRFRVDSKRLVRGRFAVGFDGSPVAAAVQLDLELAGVLVAIVEGDQHENELLGLVKYESDLAVVVYQVFHAGPTRVGDDASIAGVLGNATGGTAPVSRCPVVVGACAHGDCGSLAYLDVPWAGEGGGGRSKRVRLELNITVDSIL